jgi:ligand-binding sensor domain-containing protein
MTVDKDNNLWIVTDSGVNKFDGSSWSAYTTSNGLVNNKVSAVAVDDNDNIWFATGYGVNKFDGSSWTSYSISNMNGLSCLDIRSIGVDKDNDVIVGFGENGNGIDRFNGTNWTNLKTDDGLPGNEINSLAEDKNGNLWFAINGYSGAGYLTKYDGINWTTYSFAPDDIASMEIDNYGNVWCGTYGDGLYKYNGSIWNHFTMGNGLSNDLVTSLTIDSTGNIWCGATNGGLSKYDGLNWTIYSTSDGLIYNDIYSILCDNDGNLWYGTSNGISKFDGVNWDSFTSSNGLPFDWAVSLSLKKSGNLVALIRDYGFGAYICEYNGQSWITTEIPYELAENVILSLKIDDNDNHWISTLRGGIIGYDGTQWTSYSTKEGLLYNEIRSILTDNKGNLWIATFEGLSMIPSRTTDIDDFENQNITLNSFLLFQNYPNPFNHVTIIKYQLLKKINVTLKVYNLIGQEIKTLVSKKQPAGFYSVKWDGTNDYGNKVPSSVYIYRMKAGDIVQSKKLVLVK